MFAFRYVIKWADMAWAWVKGKSIKEIRRDRQTPWEKDYALENIGERALLKEYLQMGATYLSIFIICCLYSKLHRGNASSRIQT